MPTTLNLKWDEASLRKLKAFPGTAKALFTALKFAGRDAQRAMARTARRYVRDKKRFKVRAINKGTPLSANRAREIYDLQWSMAVSGVEQPVGNFPVTQTQRGVTVRVNRGKNKFLKGAFIAKVGSGARKHRGVFYRKGKARLPIDELFTTRISDPFEDAGMVDGVFEAAQEAFAKTFERVLPIQLEKIGG